MCVKLKVYGGLNRSNVENRYPDSGVHGAENSRVVGHVIDGALVDQVGIFILIADDMSTVALDVDCTYLCSRKISPGHPTDEDVL